MKMTEEPFVFYEHAQSGLRDLGRRVDALLLSGLLVPVFVVVLGDGSR